MAKAIPTQEQIEEVWKQFGLIYKNEAGYHGWYKGVGSWGLEWCADSLEELSIKYHGSIPGMESEK